MYSLYICIAKGTAILSNYTNRRVIFARKNFVKSISISRKSRLSRLTATGLRGTAPLFEKLRDETCLHECLLSSRSSSLVTVSFFFSFCRLTPSSPSGLFYYLFLRRFGERRVHPLLRSSSSSLLLFSVFLSYFLSHVECAHTTTFRGVSPLSRTLNHPRRPPSSSMEGVLLREVASS